jgi:hypothetical protein
MRWSASNGMMSKDKLKTQEEIKTWLKEALIRSATTQSELADGVGVSRQAVYGWLNTGKITIGSLRKVESSLGKNSPVSKGVVNESIYAVEKGECMGANIPPGVLVPIATWSTIGLDDGDIEVTGSIMCPANHSVKTYALKMEGVCMDNIFPEGDVVF